MADGGDGTLDVLLRAAGPRARIEHRRVTGPAGAPVTARLGWLDAASAVIEMAEASGLRLLPPDRLLPLAATSRGTGELIVRALDGGARHLLIGVGGTAGTDAGSGALRAIGLFLAGAGDVPLPEGGGALADLRAAFALSLDPRLAEVDIEVAVDTAATLLGPSGAARLFAPQKGASGPEVERLELGLDRFATLLERSCGVNPALRTLAGSGAGGGTGYGLAALTGARLRPGGELVAGRVHLEAAVRGASLVLTGEGRLDRSTSTGKAPAVVARIAAAAGVPCVVVAGRIDRPVDPVFSGAVELDASLAGDTAGAVAEATARALAALPD